MAKNDLVLLDGIIDDRVARLIPTDRRDEVFEFFAFEQLLKFADLSAEEIMSGWVDGQHDGGIDGLFVFVNDILVSDPRAFNWPRGKAELTVWIVTCKHHDTFQQLTIDKLVATLSELLDLGKRPGDMLGQYSKDLIDARERLVHSYRTLATRILSFKIHLAYVSRGDSAHVGDSVLARSRHVQATVQELFSGCETSFSFVGAAELIALERKSRRFSLELPFIECFAHGERYVLLSRISDYANFVRDEDGVLRRYLFDSNVRDFAGLNRVNEDIAASLQSPGDADFWWLNNGVTVLVTNAAIAGKSIILNDVQIVNGLQTTESISRYFSAGGTDHAQRAVLVKIIKTDDPAVRDAIIRATNNQTTVEQQSLHATDKIQRDIEQVLLRSGWYYDRRKNYYANQGASKEQIISPLYLAAAFVGVILRDPIAASKLKQKFMRSPASYSRVFSESHDLHVWAPLVSLLKRVDAELNSLRPSQSSASGESFLKRWRYLVALIVVSRKLGKYSFSTREFATVDARNISGSDVSDIWSIVKELSRSDYLDNGHRWERGHLFYRVCAKAAQNFSISDLQALTHVIVFDGVNQSPGLTDKRPSLNVTDEFLDSVDAVLPAQPWKQGVRLVVALELKCSVRSVGAAIQELVIRGRRNRQKDGIVYDVQGNIIAVDPDRV